MAKIEKSVVINAPWEIVDAVSTDGHRIAEWFEGIESSELDGTYPQPGGVMKTHYKAAGMTFEFTNTSQSYEKGDHLTIQMDGMLHGTQHWTVEPQGDSTKLSVVFDYNVPGGGLGKVLDKLVIERTNASNVEKSLQNLKRLIESG